MEEENKKERLQTEKNLDKDALKARKQQKKKEKKKLQKEFEAWKHEKERTSAELEKELYYTSKEPRKALATFFRNQNKVMVTSMAIADRKAMIMIRINSLIVSISIIFYRFIDDSLPMGWLVGLILILGTSIALIFAILSAKPNRRFLHKAVMDEILPNYPNLEDRNFWPPDDVSLEEYEKSMDLVVNDQRLQIGTQVRFTYVIEKYLAHKYKLLDIAYNMFLYSLVLSAITFIICRIIF